jgi:hypothetical protein
LAARRTPGCRRESQPLQPPDAATPMIKKVIAQMEARTAGSRSGKSDAARQPALRFRSETFGFRKLSDLVRKTNPFEIDQPRAEPREFGSSRRRIPAKTRAARKPAGRAQAV